MGLIADFLRFWWGLLYWNTRKSLYRAKPEQYRCPCQVASDSGKAFETECEAAHAWAKPARFKIVCPLLVKTEAGLRCSVDTREVRPFWGRAAFAYIGTFLFCYLLMVLLAFGAMKAVGYPVSYTDLAWPGHWRELRKIKSQYFLEQGNKALGRSDFREGLFNLTLAYQYDPSQYAVGLTLARFSTLMQPAQCDALFEDLMRRHPGSAKITAEYWLRSALSRGAFDVMVKISLDRLNAGEEQPPPYLHALIFSTQVLEDPATLRRFISTPAGTAWSRLITTELHLREGRRAEALAELAKPWYPKNAFNAYYQTHRLLELGKADETLLLLGAYEDIMPPTERVSTTLGALALKGNVENLEGQVSVLLRRQDNLAAVIETLSVHVMRFPNPRILKMMADRLHQTPLSAGEAADRAYLSLFLAAGVLRDQGVLNQVMTDLKQRANSPLASLAAAQEFFTDKNTLIRLDSFLPVLPISMEMCYAIHERYSLKAHP